MTESKSVNTFIFHNDWFELFNYLEADEAQDLLFELIYVSRDEAIDKRIYDNADGRHSALFCAGYRIMSTQIIEERMRYRKRCDQNRENIRSRWSKDTEE